MQPPRRRGARAARRRQQAWRCAQSPAPPSARARRRPRRHAACRPRGRSPPPRRRGRAPRSTSRADRGRPGADASPRRRRTRTSASTPVRGPTLARGSSSSTTGCSGKRSVCTTGGGTDARAVVRGERGMITYAREMTARAPEGAVSRPGGQRLRAAARPRGDPASRSRGAGWRPRRRCAAASCSARSGWRVPRAAPPP